MIAPNLHELLILTIFWGVDCDGFHRQPPLHPECWWGLVTFDTCCIPPKGRLECFPPLDTKLTYEYCCELPDSEKHNELTSGGWLDTRFFRAEATPTLEDKLDAEVISSRDLLRLASDPYVGSWCVGLTGMLAQVDPACGFVFAFIQRMVDQLRNNLISILESAHGLQEGVNVLFHRTGSFLGTVASPAYHALIEPVMRGHRYCMNVIEFTSILMLIHRDCFFPALREAFGRLVSSAKDVSQAYLKLHFSISFMSSFGIRPESTSVKKQFEPLWLFYDKIAEVGSRCTDIIAIVNGSRAEVITLTGISRPATSHGGFSQMVVLQRRVFNSWNLDHGLVASLIRLWPQQEGGHRMSIADFGAGGGHYCDFFNKTEQYDCFAYDGAEKISEHTDGKTAYLRLDLPFDLGRKFDWVMSLEVAEHLSPDAADAFVRNLRRHTSIGLILSWSCAFHDVVHPNAMGWEEVRSFLYERGLAWDENASSNLAPVLSWMKGNVNVYRPV